MWILSTTNNNNDRKEEFGVVCDCKQNETSAMSNRLWGQQVQISSNQLDSGHNMTWPGSEWFYQKKTVPIHCLSPLIDMYLGSCRVHVHHSDALLRFCPEKYYPFDAAVKNKYVVQDDYLPSWKIPSFGKYMNTAGFSFTDTLNAYIRSWIFVFLKDTEYWIWYLPNKWV